MAGNFEEFGPEASGARLAELDYAKDISSTMQNLVHVSQIQGNEAQRPMYAAQARKAGAEADVLERKAAVQKKMADLMANRAPRAGTGSAADLIFEAADIAGAAGDVDEASKLALRGTQIKASEAARDVYLADAEIKGLEKIRRYTGITGIIAASAVDQPSYDAALAKLQNMQIDISEMPADYASARGTLNQLTAQGMSVKQWVDSQISERQTKSREKADAALVTSRNATARVRERQIKVLDDAYARAVKNGGEKSEEARDLKVERARLVKTQREALEVAKPPLLPADQTKRVEGKVYLGPDGVKKYVWTKKPDGTMGARELSAAEESKWSEIGSAAKGALSGAASFMSHDYDADIMAGDDAEENPDG